MKGANENSLRDKILNGGLRDLNPPSRLLLQGASALDHNYSSLARLCPTPKFPQRALPAVHFCSLVTPCRSPVVLYPRCTPRSHAFVPRDARQLHVISKREGINSLQPCRTKAYGTSRHIQGIEFLTGEPNLVIATGGGWAAQQPSQNQQCPIPNS